MNSLIFFGKKFLIFLTSSPISWSLRFFLIAILFLVFDLEISYLFPWSCSSNIIELKGQLIIIIFLIILALGLIYEWVKGGLEWE